MPVAACGYSHVSQKCVEIKQDCAAFERGPRLPLRAQRGRDDTSRRDIIITFSRLAHFRIFELWQAAPKPIFSSKHDMEKYFEVLPLRGFTGKITKNSVIEFAEPEFPNPEPATFFRTPNPQSSCFLTCDGVLVVVMAKTKQQRHQPPAAANACEVADGRRSL